MVKMVLTYLFWQWKRKRWLEVFLGQRWCYVRQIKINLIYVIEQFTKIMCPNSKKTFPRTCSDSIHLKRLIEVQYIQNAYIRYCNVGPVQVKLLGRHKQPSLYREACITFEGFANWPIVFVHGYTKPWWMNNDREGSVVNVANFERVLHIIFVKGSSLHYPIVWIVLDREEIPFHLKVIVEPCETSDDVGCSVDKKYNSIQVIEIRLF